jgi:hypothetical protein
MRRGELYRCFQKIESESKDLTFLANQRFDVKRGKSGSRQKNQIYNTVFQNQGEQKGNVRMSTGAAKANRFFVIFHNINYNFAAMLCSFSAVVVCPVS